MGKITQQALMILENNFYIYKELPASISGKYHQGETAKQHLTRTAKFMRLMCESLNISEEDTDMLVACAYLHDIGIYLISFKGRSDLLKHCWYADKTGYSRLNHLMKIHPIISAEILEDFKIDRKEEIQDIIKRHMGHWYKNTPRPKTLFDRLLVQADYLATKFREK
jgi:putative nucleotidyltransferase with HDIG domain